MKALNINYHIKKLNIWSSLLIVLLYVLIKFVLAIIIFQFVETLSNDIFLQVELGEILSTIATLIVLLVFFKPKVLNCKIKRTLLYNKKLLVSIILVAICLRVFLDPFIRFQNIINNDLPNLYNLQTIGLSPDIIIKAIRIIILQVIFEEFLFRKIIFNGLLNKYNSFWIATMISSAFFAITHLSISNMIPTLFLGISTAYLYYISKNIFFPIFLHFFYNLLWFLIYLNPKSYWYILKQLNFDFSYWVLILLSMMILYFLCRYSLQKLKL